tara:strand:+ start:4730 stop:5365 length:636 start_codon:yes stop_codon:yes gene_type:complete
LNNVAENVAHEFAHIISGDSDHGLNFNRQLLSFGFESDNSNLFANIRKRCGIPNKIAANIGNISGVQNMLTDYHLLQAYRKFSQKILGTEGHWEVINEGNSTVDGDSLSAKDQLIRLYPTPKGAFPVVVLYVPVIQHFRSPQARKVCYDMMLAEAKCVLGHSRRKISGMPTPDGGSISYDGADLVQEGEKMKAEIVETAIKLGEPMGFWLW